MQSPCGYTGAGVLRRTTVPRTRSPPARNVPPRARSPFPARFDGTDRWLQRTFVVEDLAASAADRHGHVITTAFA